MNWRGRTWRAWDIAARWGGLVCIAILLLLYAANVAFYAGSAIGVNWSWRLEHGRLKIAHNPGGSRESFYVAINNEGLHFAPEFGVYGIGHWMMNVPLWMPLALGSSLTGLAWRRWWKRQRLAEGIWCRTCGYELRGLTSGQCPECGKRS